MAGIKSLAKDTAIYGLSSIVGRFLNYLLVPLYTAKLAAAEGGYGVITNVYAYVALLLVLLTYGMETTFFRFSNKEGEDADTVYSTTLTAVGTTSLLFIALVVAFLPWISSQMGYAEHPEYIWIMATVVAMDAFQAIPFAYLRYKHRPVKFAALKLLFVVLNIVLNVLYFAVLPALYKQSPDGIVSYIYSPEIGVGYAFALNLVCTGVVMIFLLPELKVKWRFDRDLLRRMLGYSWPILVLGVAGILNQTADKILFPFIYDAPDAKAQLGIYGAASKIAMIMALITQAFRYAYEPFVFGKSRDKDNKETYSVAMTYFVAFTLLAFLAVMAGIDLLRHIIGSDYWEGLKVVPIVMAAEIMMGVYFNLSFWYKLTDRTIWGAIFSAIGCAALLIVNIVFVPRYGYVACAWGGFAGYGVAMLLSYFVGQKYYPIKYSLGKIALYVAAAAATFGLYCLIRIDNQWLNTAVRLLLMLPFCALLYRLDIKPALRRRKA